MEYVEGEEDVYQVGVPGGQDRKLAYKGDPVLEAPLDAWVAIQYYVLG